jgi:dipeptidyl aminopeptidase/acylaminoacyl peptidase
LTSFGPKWKLARLSDDLVIMGHSYGGITVHGSAISCPKAKAVISIDPWFFPHAEDEVLTLES